MDEKVRIEKIMQEEKMNNAQFALETGIQSSTLSHILNGRNKVSLPVLKQILSRFPSISSDWLIFGSGPMYRQEKQSQSPTLFDFSEGKTSKSVDYIEEKPLNNSSEKETNQRKEEIPPAEKPVLPPFPTFIEKAPRKIKRIIVYFDDNSFQEFVED